MVMRNMKRICTIAVLLCLTAAAPAQAQMYWRIDAGLSLPNKADFKDNDFYNSGVMWTGSDPFNPQPGTLNNIDGSIVFGAGVGYRFTSRLRGDVTFAYRPLYTLDDTLNEFGLDVSYRADITSMTLMANAYYDFTAGGVRPYIGAGIGWAQNKTEALIQDFRLGFHNTFSGATKDNTAFALMAGVGIPYSSGTLDIGLRYMDMGKFETGTSAAFGITGGQTGKLSAYELTLGFRF